VEGGPGYPLPSDCLHGGGATWFTLSAFLDIPTTSGLALLPGGTVGCIKKNILSAGTRRVGRDVVALASGRAVLSLAKLASSSSGVLYDLVTTRKACCKRRLLISGLCEHVFDLSRTSCEEELHNCGTRPSRFQTAFSLLLLAESFT